IVISHTRVGRDIIASGSDRAAARIAGVPVEGLVIGAFAFSGACAALAGALLSYSLASASPTGLSDVLVPALTGVIIGGVSLSGGTGRPLGIACGVLVLSVLRSGFNAIGAEPWISEVATGSILLIVSALDAPSLLRRWWRSKAASA
ncbi:MAG: ABC transporter permease subunit, partial [Pseudolabrys sp.]